MFPNVRKQRLHLSILTLDVSHGDMCEHASCSGTKHEAFYSLILTGLTTGASRGSPDAPLSDRQETHGIFHGFSFNVSRSLTTVCVSRDVANAQALVRQFAR